MSNLLFSAVMTHYYTFWHFMMHLWSDYNAALMCLWWFVLLVCHNEPLKWRHTTQSWSLKYVAVRDHSRTSVRDYGATPPHLDPYGSGSRLTCSHLLLLSPRTLVCFLCVNKVFLHSAFPQFSLICDNHLFCKCTKTCCLKYIIYYIFNYNHIGFER